MSQKFIPGSEADSETIFTYPFFVETQSKEFIKGHGKIMFIIRGPPGTGKNSLTDLMTIHFPCGVKCCADDYFSQTFNRARPSKETLKDSHSYCRRKVKHECIKGTHPIIVSNTHMKKMEMQEYLKFAEEYEYTIIVTSTVDKFEISPEILAKSNTKGLTVDYFRNRLKSWQDVFPNLMGWFLCLDDSFYVLQQLQCALDSLLGDGRFCRVFNAFDSESLLNGYKAKTILCCVAAYMKTSPFELKKYYKSEEVRTAYGRCFTIAIPAYLVTQSDIFAIVQLEDPLKQLMFKTGSEKDLGAETDDDVESLVAYMGSASFLVSYQFKHVPLSNAFSKKSKFVSTSENDANLFKLDEISFIHLAQQSEKPFSAWELNNLFTKSLYDELDEKGEITIDQKNELENGYVSYRLSNDTWMIKPPNIVSVKTVFTGLYK